ncbi:MAG TPA: glycosyltransferase family 2 protein [Anaerolineaceae bacterium]|nr:glycosyltransferase family 2 protein [Anaerolineaceae bacterium]
MDTNPLISIITPSYNQADYLEMSMLSVLNQDYPNLEYIVVDGNSTDGSQEIIKKFEDRLSWWVSEKDDGQADAFNKGIKHAQGKYIGWLNSDDLYLPGTISEAVSLLENNQDLAFVFGDVQSINEKGIITNIMCYGDWQLVDLMQFKIIGQPAVFMRRDLLEKVGGLDPSFHFLLDHLLWLKLASKAKINYSHKLWAAARFHMSAKNVAQAEKFGQEAYRLVDWMQNNPDLESVYQPNNKRILAGAHRMNARYLLDSGKFSESAKVYWKGLCTDFVTVIPEWHRWLYAIFAPLGLYKIKDLYLKLKFKLKRPDLMGKKS